MSAEVPAARRAACHPPAPAATTTDQRMRATAIPVVERYRRPARWLHAGIYTTVLVLLATGWWLLAGHEGHPSPLARLTTMPDTSLHKLFGWALTGIAAVGVLFGVRAIPSFLSESVRLRRSELHWFIRWPAAVFSGRFGWHQGRFDPGQRRRQWRSHAQRAVLCRAACPLGRIKHD